MAKKGMARPGRTHAKKRSEAPAVPEIQGKAKQGEESAEKPVSKVYPVIDNDLARDNVENDIPAADLEDL